MDLDVPDLPEGWQPVQAVAVFECLDTDGNLALSMRHTEGMTPWAAAGLAQAGADTWSSDTLEAVRGEDPDEDDDPLI